MLRLNFAMKSVNALLQTHGQMHIGVSGFQGVRVSFVTKAVVNHGWWGVTAGYPFPTSASGILLLGVATCRNHLVMVKACQCHLRKHCKVFFCTGQILLPFSAPSKPACVFSIPVPDVVAGLFLQIKLRLALPWLWPFSLSGVVTLSPVCFHLLQCLKILWAHSQMM